MMVVLDKEQCSSTISLFSGELVWENIVGNSVFPDVQNY